MAHPKTVSSGDESLDKALQGLRLGDNVVWQVDSLEAYGVYARAVIAAGLAQKRPCVYMRFGGHAPVLPPDSGAEAIGIDPSQGFDRFSSQVHEHIRTRGPGAFYVFDNISNLVEPWATDEQLANFFQVTCPYLAELDTVAYFALTRGQHAHEAVARIRETTQVLIDLYHAGGERYIHPIKVWDRYSEDMFLPHRVDPHGLSPVAHSGQAASVSGSSRTWRSWTREASQAPWDSVMRKLEQARDELGPHCEAVPEVAALKKELVAMMMGGHPTFTALAETYFTLDCLFAIRGRMIGAGRIGGKAAGMLLARRILQTGPDAARFTATLEDHDSFYVGSDVFFTFLVNNGLFRLRLELSRDLETLRGEFEDVERRFLDGVFPPAIVEQFRDMLDYFGQAPIIVRSSSLLEDSFGNAFAGKYRSEFCPNQGSPDARLDQFLRAIKAVYASALSPDALAYRERRGMMDNDEQMAILVQRVSGAPYRSCFFPSLAGVAFSHNLYAWNERIDPAQGAARLVFGLGTRAVDRVESDYPRLVSLSQPHLRPEANLKAARYSQRKVDVIDLRANALATLPLRELIDAKDYPNLHMYVSEHHGDHLADPIGNALRVPPEKLVLTFNKLLHDTAFASLLNTMLQRIESVYGQPVDTEFTATLDAQRRVAINMLQCRPMHLPGSQALAAVPDDLSEGRRLFQSNKVINGGDAPGLRYILYVDPAAYSSRASYDDKVRMGRATGRITSHPTIKEGGVILVGPGRWGSSDVDLGVNVTYADIAPAAALVEVAREEAGYVPEVSYGTHFFLDLVESGIIYMAIFPGGEGSSFNDGFFAEAPNALPDLFPDLAPLQHLIHLVDAPAVAGGRFVRILAAPHRREGLCFLE